jgi:hypothetical protein
MPNLRRVRRLCLVGLLAGLSPALPAFEQAVPSTLRPAQGRPEQGGGATGSGQGVGQDRVSLGPTPTGTFEFRVLGPDNQPLVDITAAEMTLKINGRVREIRSLQLYRSDPAPAGAAGASRAADHAPQPPEPFGTNYVSGPGRELLIVVDDDSFGSGRVRSLKPALGNLLATLNANDRAGLITIPAGGISIAPTRQHDLIETAIAAMVGRQGGGDTTSDRYCRALITLSSLQGVLERYVGANPATIVFFSGGIVAPNTEFSARVGQPGETCELRAKNFQDLGLFAQKAPVDFRVAYIPEDTSGGTGTSNELQAGLENLSGVTGNAMVRLAGESGRLMAQLADETSAYYVATFDIDPSERKGASYRVDLKAGRDGAKIRARQFVTFERDGSGKQGPSLKDLIKVAAVSRELPLRATAFSAREAGSDKLKLVTLFEPRDRFSTLAEATVAVYDDAGKLTAQWMAAAADLRRSPVVAGILVKPGQYRVRVAAIDADGRRGTVDHYATVELVPAGTSTLSALVLGSRTVDGFRPRLLFGREDAMAFGYVEVYNVPKDAQIGASLELALTANGPAEITVPTTMSTVPQGDMRVLTASVPISALAPGDYVMRLSVSVAGQPIGRVMRTLRKAGQ